MDVRWNDDVLENGFCWGKYQLRIDNTGRLRLNRAVVDVLAVHEISRLWRCPDPTAEQFILSPLDHRTTFVTVMRNHFQESEAFEEAWRCICTGTDAAIDSQGRISIQKVCLEHAGIAPPQQVTVLGVGYWFEVTMWSPQSRGDAAC